MRIGVDVRYLFGPRRGVGQYLHYLLSHLTIISDHEFALWYNERQVDLSERELPWDRPNVGEYPCRWPSNALELLWRYLSFPRIEHFLGEIDVFHNPVAHCVPPVRGALVVTIHDFVALRYPERYPSQYIRRYRDSLRLIESRADRVIAVSNSTKADILRFTGIREDRIAVVHNGIDQTFRPIDDGDAVDAVLAQLGLARGYILYVGGADVQKNLDRLIVAYSRLPADLRDHYRLVLAGNPSWGYERLAELASSMKIEARVTFPGYVPDEDLPSLYSGASLVVFPSLYEGFGFIPLEAMACGTPTVCSNVSSIPEVVGDAGVLVDPLSVDELAAEIQRVLTDSTLRARLIEKGLQRAGELTWDRAARLTLAAYGHAAAARG